MWARPAAAMGLVADAIARLLGRCSVIAKAIGLHDEAEFRPVEVDLEPAHARLRPRLGQPHSARNRQESPLELGVRERGCHLVEESAQRANAGLSLPQLEPPHLLAKRLRF